ncbi:MAG: hypothetical protein AAGF11_00890 [Myxococcota bacterium]
MESMRRVLLGLMAMLICGLAAPRQVHANTPRGVEQEMAVVRVTIQQDDGQVFRETKATAWGEQAQFDLGGHELDLALTDRSHLGVHYALHGSKVVDRAMEARPRSRVVVYADEDVKVTVQVIPVKIRVHGKTVQ